MTNLTNMEQIMENTTEEEIEAIMEDVLDSISAEDIEKIDKDYGGFEERYTEWCLEKGDEFIDKWIRTYGEVTNVQGFLLMCCDAVNLFVTETLAN